MSIVSSLLQSSVGTRIRITGAMDVTYSGGNVARARFVEDLVAEQAECGGGQYVILGAGLDTFAQRNASRTLLRACNLFEVDRPASPTRH